MNMHRPHRGRHLVEADKGFAQGGLIARLLAGSAHRLLDRIDRGLRFGTIIGILPGGEVRRLGGTGMGPEATVTLHDWRALARLATTGSVGWYRAWEAREWSSPDPVQVFDLFMRNRQSLGKTGRARGLFRLINRFRHSLRRNSKRQARDNIAFHYDLGNDFYATWLDETMTYSSARFALPYSDAEPLAAAQHRKIGALLDRLNLQPGQRLLEIGCGWGALMAQAVQTYGVEAVGLTLSTEQKTYAETRFRERGIADKARIDLCDYRDAIGQYDAVASVEMVEAVGEQYWPAYLETIHRLLKPGGRAAIQYIAIADDIFEGYAASADFIQTYIFPGGMLLSESRFRAIAERTGFDWQDADYFGPDYAETLKRWRQRFDAAVEQGNLPPGFDARFVRLWRYYLMYCEGGFRGGGITVGQVTLVK